MTVPDSAVPIPSPPHPVPPRAGIRRQLRLLLIGLGLLLLCSLGLAWNSITQGRADARLADRVSTTLDGLDRVLAVQHSLTELRRMLVLNLEAPVGAGDPVERLRQESAQALSDYREQVAGLGSLDAESGARLARLGQELLDNGQRVAAAYRDGNREQARLLLAEFPRLGSPAEAVLERLSGRLQDELHRAQDERAAERRSASILAAAALSLLVLVVLGALRLVLGSILPPLDRIQASLARIGRGERLETPPVQGEDEFGQVGSALLELSQFTANLQQVAYTDGLTNLPNRARFEADLQAGIEAGGCFALVFADLDQFRTINDGYGHHFGDRVLCGAAGRLRALAGAGQVYRYSGDLFVLILPQPGEAPRSRAGAEVERLRQGMAELGQIDSRRLAFCTSFGVALFPEDGREPEDLVSAADAAMYQAKRHGRNTVQFARSNYAEQARNRLELADELRVALREGQVTPYYQPILDLAAGEVVCAEALARWKHPTRGFVPPDEFIGIAEDSGQIDALTDLLLRQSCTAAARWHAEGLSRRLAFNLSARQVRPGVVEMIAGVLRDTGLPPQRLEVEITESAIIERPELAERLLRELRSLGVGVALDDFGTGYSSLSYLLRFPIDKIKVDRSFVSQLEGQRQAAKIVAATIALASSLEITLVAEGVERLGQMLTLYELGCRQQQGWLFSKALPEAEFDRWARTAPLRLDGVVRSQMDASNEPISEGGKRA